MGDVVRGPWKQSWPLPSERVDPARVKWRRGRPPPPEVIRRHCVDCQRPFDPKRFVPETLLCADCRAERARTDAEPEPPTLFDGGDTST